MSRFWRVAGAPGTGKTTWILRQVRRAIRHYRPWEITLLSFSRSATVELQKRLAEEGIEIPEANVGTLHALARSRLGYPAVVYRREWLERWSQQYPQWVLRPEDLHESPWETEGEGGGLPWLRRYTALRQRGWPTHMWPLPDLLFAKAWKGFKGEVGALDFPDLIEEAQGGTRPPGQGLLLVDEAQDLSPVEARLVHNWGRQCEGYALVGDDDQTIYTGLKGATPQAFLEPPTANQIVLEQSYRVPRAVYWEALEGIQGVQQRWAKNYHPTAREGRVLRAGVSYLEPTALLGLLDERPTMLLAQAGYMLEGVLKLAREMGLPFHNPYRPHSRNFNFKTKASPTLIVGTIHSVKGGEAERVILIPDRSPSYRAAMQQSRAMADESRRLEYVVLTRAREEVVLLSPAI